MKKLVKRFFCPVNGWDCPYFEHGGACALVEQGCNPVDECDDAAFFADEELGDWFVWEDENGTCWDRAELLEMGYHFINDEPILPPLLAE